MADPRGSVINPTRLTGCPTCGAPLQHTMVREFYADLAWVDVNQHGQVVDWPSEAEEDYVYEDGERTEDRFYCANDHNVGAKL